MFVSCVISVAGKIWIATGGSGMFIYKVHTHTPVASWGEGKEREVFTLLHVKKARTVLALTHEGIYVFDANNTVTSESAKLQHDLFIPMSGLVQYNEGVVIPDWGNINEPEIWLCSRSGHGISILHHKKLIVMDEIYTADKARVVRHMQPMLVNGQSYLAIANRHLIECWDVKKREMKIEIDIVEHCIEFHESQSKCNQKQCTQ